MTPFNKATALVLFAAASAIYAESPQAQARLTVVLAEDVDWGYLNPARGELSPGAANLWGDRAVDTATGMLVRFNKGFQSPPHIHNITYRGIVIKGQMHNDDPDAQPMWMPATSFWTQPAGADHITAAAAADNLIYLEIDAGPYRVQPSSKAYDNGEHPLNVHADNLVWQDGDELYSLQADDVEAAQLWQSDTGVNGALIRFPAGFSGFIKTQANEFRAVLITGEIDYRSAGAVEAVSSSSSLKAGSYIESSGTIEHEVHNQTDDPVTLYVRTDGPYIVKGNDKTRR
ncbi:DUF4437 domain-containing protein [uncultured Alcanivorax sp.]|jgi:hypothetical protein|uniref:DUF4437 domain-containing protein n=1 Tax=uncultured Alcanivorax sp. TaxID=191215 RepID=UPI0030DBE10C